MAKPPKYPQVYSKQILPGMIVAWEHNGGTYEVTRATNRGDFVELDVTNLKTNERFANIRRIFQQQLWLIDDGIPPYTPEDESETRSWLLSMIENSDSVV